MKFWSHAVKFACFLTCAITRAKENPSCELRGVYRFESLIAYLPPPEKAVKSRRFEARRRAGYYLDYGDSEGTHLVIPVGEKRPVKTVQILSLESGDDLCKGNKWARAIVNFRWRGDNF